jgi:L-ascorbate metabolism protein UlaG (beta-lactamase superfamily)
MDIQFFGANCIVINTKQLRITIDDNLAELGANSPTKAGDLVLFTTPTENADPKVEPKLVIDGPGEYEVANVSVKGMSVRANMDSADEKTATLYKIITDDLNLVVTGHIYPELSEEELETIGLVDILCIPVGGNGYTTDPAGALNIIKKIEPKIVIPTNYDDKALKYPVPQQSLEEALKILAMEPKEVVTRLKIKASDLSDALQVIVLERS